MYFDRRISEVLLNALESGPLAWLPAVCRESSRLDLQLRGNPGTNTSCATAYVGTTKVLDVHEQRGRFRVAVGKSAQDWGGMELPWSALALLQPPQLIEPYWGALARHTARAAAGVPTRWADNEGRIQTLFARHVFEDVLAIDREAVMGFASAHEKKRVHDQITKRFTPVLRRMRERWSEPNARESWKKADLLGLDREGNLLVIEVKRGDDPRLRWTPAQVAYYAALFDWWASEIGHDATVVLESMLLQRERLGLVPTKRPKVASPVNVVPIVAVGNPINEFALGPVREMSLELAAEDSFACGSIPIWIMDDVRRSLTLDASD